MRSGAFAIACWAPSAAFLVVVALHLHQNRTANLNPWLGGGFGMFSTVDRPWPQGLSIEAEDASGKRYFVEWRPEWYRGSEVTARYAVVSQPSREELSRVAGYALRPRRSNTTVVRQTLQALKASGLSDRVALREAEAELSGVEMLRTPVEPGAIEETGVVRATASVWRLRFDGASTRFRSEAVGEPGEASMQ